MPPHWPRGQTQPLQPRPAVCPADEGAGAEGPQRTRPGVPPEAGAVQRRRGQRLREREGKRPSCTARRRLRGERGLVVTSRRGPSPTPLHRGKHPPEPPEGLILHRSRDAGGPAPLPQPDLAAPVLAGRRRFPLRAAMTTAAVAADEPSRAGASRPRQPGSPTGPQSLALGSQGLASEGQSRRRAHLPAEPPSAPQPSSAEEPECLHSPGLQLVEKQNMFFTLKLPLKNNGLNQA